MILNLHLGVGHSVFCQMEGVGHAFLTSLKKLGWIKLDSQRTIHKAVMVYKSLNGLTPDYLSSKFVDRDTEGKLAIPQPHTNYMKNSFSYSGGVLWNSLPIELRQAASLNAFRAGCERFFSSGSI